ncbi:MAG: T9SS C-terminal target domain-containing protein [Ignavibacteriae bacterium]|nr:MAG: T9SS C-terminal target domain-containing protein [Ignavibacteriota bacterium]
MVKSLYYSSVFVSLLSLASFAAPPSGGKVKIAAVPQGQTNMLSSLQLQNQVLPSLRNNLFQFAGKMGVTMNHTVGATAGVQSYGMRQSQLNASLQLPSMDRPAASNITVVSWNRETGTPRFIEIQPLNLKKSSHFNAASMELAANNFLVDHKSLLRMNNPQGELLLKSSLFDNLGMSHLKYSQMYNGIEVWGKEVIVHLDAQGNVVSLNGSYESTPTILTDFTGKLDQSGAVNRALSDLQAKEGIDMFSPAVQKLFHYSGPVARKIIWYDENHIPHLAWNVEVRSGLSKDWLYFIDAGSGAVLHRYNAVCFDGAKTATAPDLNGVNRTFGTYQMGSTYYMMDASQPMFDAAKSAIPDNPLGAVAALDLRSTDLTANAQIFYVSSSNNLWSDASSVSAHFNAMITYQYYLNTYNRKSIDDKNMTIYSIVHATQNGKGMDNAFWNGNVMCYGDGNVSYKPLAGGLDVAAHEMTHGVTQYSANLEYQNQSGALNESWSDVFGALVDTLNWTMGEKIIKDFSSFPTGVLRDLQNPHNGGTPGSSSWQPAKMSEYQQLPNTQDGDNGGVHINSGIPNHAFYFAAANLGRNKAGQIWYRALTVYLTRTSQFIDARIATEKAAADLYGASSNELQAVKSAWDNVEVFEGAGTPLPPSSQLAGDQWILLTSEDKSTLYMAKTTITSNSDIFALSSTPVLNRPTVTDASGMVLFVDNAHRLKVLYANPSNPQEQYLDTSAVWRGVAAGPGLNSIALISRYQDTTIYYFDFTNNISKTFKIIAQTFDGQSTKTALYADEMSFDPTGRYLLFDCYNEISKSDGSKLSYWNINLLDIQQNNIQSVFPPPSAGISVGNPSFSKTSQTHFAFDYLDSQNDLDYVMAADFNTGNVGVIAGPFASNSLTILGYPTYSGNDKTIAYHTTQISNGTTVESIRQVPLKDNMLEPSGASQSYILHATFPGWFVVGTRTDVRTIPGEMPRAFELDQNYPNPFNPATTIRYVLPQRAFITLELFDVLGRTVRILANGMEEAGRHEIEFNGTNLPSGVYLYRLNTGNVQMQKKMVLLK